MGTMIGVMAVMPTLESRQVGGCRFDVDSLYTRSFRSDKRTLKYHIYSLYLVCIYFRCLITTALSPFPSHLLPQISHF